MILNAEPKQIQTYRHYINMLSQNHIHSVICKSRAGLGKSYTTIKILKGLNVRYTYKSGYTTALALYRTLYENSDAILIMDDMETIFDDNKALSILKSALWDVDGKRMIGYRSSSRKTEDLPDKFEYRGKIILLINDLKPRHSESFKAFISRTIFYDMDYSFKDTLMMSYQIISEKTDINHKIKNRTWNIVCNNVKKSHEFNFRILDKLIEFVKYDYNESEYLFKNLLTIDPDLDLVEKLIQSPTPVKEQIKQFEEITGKSRKTYFRYKQKLN